MRAAATSSLLLAILVSVCATAGSGCAIGSKSPASHHAATAKDLPVFNQLVLSEIAKFPADGTHDYWWPKSGEAQYDGCSRDMFLDGTKVMSGEPGARTYCCGLTLEVFLNAYNAALAKKPAGANSPVTPANWDDFQRVWFVEKLNGPGPSAALAKYGIGREIAASEAQAGDFVQIWRTPKAAGKTPSGHSVVFLDWVRDDDGNVVGLRYWSTQTVTKGIHERVEYFGPFGGMSTENTTFGRVELPAWQ